MSTQREDWEKWKERNGEWFEPLVLLVLGLFCIGMALLILVFWIPLFMVEQPWRKKKLQP